MSGNLYLRNQLQCNGDEVGEQEVRRLELTWDCAIKNYDVAHLLEMMADDYIVTKTTGETVDKSEILESISLSNSTPTSMFRDITEVRVYGDTAIVIGCIIWEVISDGSNQNGRIVGKQAKYIKVYVKGPKGWQAVIAQATQIEETPFSLGYADGALG
jgi:ketosteroid isomerase-like protein